MLPHAESHAPRPHPDAPQEIVENFDHYKKLHDSGPHFDPEKLVKHGAAEGVAQGEPVAADETSTIYDLPSRFWDTPALRWSPAEMEAINVCHTHSRSRAARRCWMPNRRSRKRIEERRHERLRAGRAVVVRGAVAA